MYRLLIVDDEDIIVDGLFSLFTEKTSFDLDVYRAYSAMEAMELLKQMRIDIVITDVRMPKISGLELSEYIAANWPLCKVIFLTGYKSFDYAVHAVKNNVVEYVVKTEGDNVLINALKKAIDALDKSYNVEKLTSKVKEQMKIIQTNFQRDFTRTLLESRIDQIDINQQTFDDIGIKLKADLPVILLVGRLEYKCVKDKSLEERIECYYLLDSIIEHDLSERADKLFSVMDGHYLIWLLQPAENTIDNNSLDEAYKKMGIYVQGMLENIQKSYLDSFKMDVTFAIYTQPVLWSEVGKAFSDLQKVYKQFAGSSTGLILTEHVLNEEYTEIQIEVNRFLEKIGDYKSKIFLLQLYLDAGNGEDFKHVLNGIIDYLREIKSMNFTPALEVYFSIAIMFIEYINRRNNLETIAFKIGITKLMHIDEYNSWEDAAGYLNELTDIIFNLQKQNHDETTSHIIIKLKEYINQHLNEDVTLVKLADQVMLNPYYISRLFKQETGVNLSEYIYEKKVLQAKTLLTDQSIKIQEISKLLGFETSSYFARFFKKYTGRTPQEFREYITDNK